MQAQPRGRASIGTFHLSWPWVWLARLILIEAKLRESFGFQYDDYRRAAWGVVPGLF